MIIVCALSLFAGSGLQLEPFANKEVILGLPKLFTVTRVSQGSGLAITHP
jgi:hypothetical protein